MFNVKNFLSGSFAREYFRGCGSYGEICGEVTRDGQTIINTSDAYRVTCAYEKDAYGVFTRKDTFGSMRVLAAGSLWSPLLRQQTAAPD